MFFWPAIPLLQKGFSLLNELQSQTNHRAVERLEELSRRTTRAVLETSLGVVDFLLPPECCVCEKPGPLFFCEDCQAEIRHIEPPYCSRCGYPGVSGSCPDCSLFAPQGGGQCDVLRQVGEYTGSLRVAIHRFKYEGMRCLAGELSQLLIHWIDSGSHVWRKSDLVVSVPGRWNRAWPLGYYHSHELARRVAAHLNLPLARPVVRLPGASQMRLAREERLLNAPRLYSLSSNRNHVAGKQVLIIDDVVTTGATAHAIADLLKRAGATRVRMLALARSR